MKSYGAKKPSGHGSVMVGSSCASTWVRVRVRVKVRVRARVRVRVRARARARVRVRVRARVRARVGSSWASTSSSEVGMATPMKSVRCVHSHRSA